MPMKLGSRSAGMATLSDLAGSRGATDLLQYEVHMRIATHVCGSANYAGYTKKCSIQYTRLLIQRPRSVLLLLVLALVNPLVIVFFVHIRVSLCRRVLACLSAFRCRVVVLHPLLDDIFRVDHPLLQYAEAVLDLMPEGEKQMKRQRQRIKPTNCQSAGEADGPSS